MEFFIEIGTEELPASFIEPAVRQLEEKCKELLALHRISFGSIHSFGTPRRFGVCVCDLPDKGVETNEEILGPSIQVAFDPEGKPKIPAIKFAEKVGVSVEQLVIKETEKGKYISSWVLHKGVETQSLLQKEMGNVLKSLEFPKTMRWGSEKVPFARPVQWICALWGQETLSFEFAGVQSSNLSSGHRFQAPDFFQVTSFSQFQTEIQKRYVVFSTKDRLDRIVQESEKLASSVNGKIWEDNDILQLCAHLVEYPVPILCHFEEKYLELPKEVLRTSMKHHLKCFSVTDKQGQMLPYFVPVSALKSQQQEVVQHGYQRVLRARLADARFFWDEDLKVSLQSFTQKLDTVIFQSQLGSYGDKVRRIEGLCQAICQQLNEEQWSEKASRAAQLCKSDLLTGMVGEFPDLQGIMGRYYALAQGEDPQVAQAIQEHYLPAGQEDPLSESFLGTIVSLADKLDTLAGGFAADLKPTGNTDPYGLRRQSIAIIRILREKELPLTLDFLLNKAIEVLGSIVPDPKTLKNELLVFMQSRFVPLFQKDGLDKDIVSAVFTLDKMASSTVSSLEKLLFALKRSMESEVFQKVTEAFKRVNNLLKSTNKNGMLEGYNRLGEGFFAPPSFSLEISDFVEPQEIDLFERFKEVEKQTRSAYLANDFDLAMTCLSSLQSFIDSLFDHVRVLCEDSNLREKRLQLLVSIANLSFVDFSQINAEDSK